MVKGLLACAKALGSVPNMIPPTPKRSRDSCKPVTHKAGSERAGNLLAESQGASRIVVPGLYAILKNSAEEEGGRRGSVGRTDISAKSLVPSSSQTKLR